MTILALRDSSMTVTEELDISALIQLLPDLAALFPLGLLPSIDSTLTQLQNLLPTLESQAPLIQQTQTETKRVVDLSPDQLNQMINGPHTSETGEEGYQQITAQVTTSTRDLSAVPAFVHLNRVIALLQQARNIGGSILVTEPASA